MTTLHVDAEISNTCVILQKSPPDTCKTYVRMEFTPYHGLFSKLVVEFAVSKLGIPVFFMFVFDCSDFFFLQPVPAQHNHVKSSFLYFALFLCSDYVVINQAGWNGWRNIKQE